MADTTDDAQASMILWGVGIAMIVGPAVALYDVFAHSRLTVGLATAHWLFELGHVVYALLAVMAASIGVVLLVGGLGSSEHRLKRLAFAFVFIIYAAPVGWFLFAIPSYLKTIIGNFF